MLHNVLQLLQRYFMA